MAGIFLVTVSSVGMYLFEHPAVIFSFRFLSGVGASTWVAFTVLYNSYFENGKSDRSIGRIQACNQSGKIAASLLGALGSQVFGIAAPFYISGITGLIGFIASFAVAETSAQRKPVKLEELISVLKNRALLFSSALSALFQIVIFATTLGFTTVYARQLGAQQYELGILLLLYSVAALFGSLAIGSGINEKIGDRYTICIGFLLTAVGMFFLPEAKTLLGVYICHSLSGLSSGVLISFFMARSIRYMPPEQKTTAMGIYQAIYSVGMMLGPVIMGYLLDYTSFQHSYQIMSLICVFTLIAAWVIMIQEEKKKSGGENAV
jgi:predicted MFS family arabinose efflux permease